MPLFDSWDSLGRTAVTGAAACAALVLFLRISGKQTLATMNAADALPAEEIGFDELVASGGSR